MRQFINTVPFIMSLCLLIVLGFITHKHTSGLNKLEDELDELYRLNKERNLLVRELISKIKVEQFRSNVKSSMGVVTAYSPYDDQNGLNSDGNPNSTSTGTKPGPGTIAVDPKRIPYGSQILIVYEDGSSESGIACDTGGAMRNAPELLIDVYRDTYDEAMDHGVKEALILWIQPTEKD